MLDLDSVISSFHLRVFVTNAPFLVTVVLCAAYTPSV
jgi:hypothetical protein